MSDDKSHSATNEPWKKPGQTSQDPANHQPVDDAAEQKKKAKDADWKKADIGN